MVKVLIFSEDSGAAFTCTPFFVGADSRGTILLVITRFRPSVQLEINENIIAIKVSV
jgi:hypothetical protein